jgi:Bacterial regulatory proteins, luxR family
MLAAGRSNQAIARELVVSLDTVKKHVSHVLGKLGAANRTEAVARARRLSLIALQPLKVVGHLGRRPRLDPRRATGPSSLIWVEWMSSGWTVRPIGACVYAGVSARRERLGRAECNKAPSMYEMEGALSASPLRIRQLPGFPGTARRPPVPGTRANHRFPGCSRVPGLPSDGARFQR